MSAVPVSSRPSRIARTAVNRWCVWVWCSSHRSPNNRHHPLDLVSSLFARPFASHCVAATDALVPKTTNESTARLDHPSTCEFKTTIPTHTHNGYTQPQENRPIDAPTHDGYFICRD